MNKILLGMILISLAIVIIACVGKPVEVSNPLAKPTPNASSVDNIDIGDVQRYVDNEAQVVCWIYDGFYSGGISCLPQQYTALPLP